MRRAVVMAHYDQDGVIDAYVVEALRRYRAIAERVVLVSAAADRLPAALAGVVDDFLIRRNEGYDFCSWRAGIAALGPRDRYDELVCVNDSVYGPLFDLSPCLDDRRVAAADLWGMCLSDQGTLRRGRAVACPHIQSWFFAFRRGPLVSEAFDRFWQGVEPLATKNDIIDRYEIGMSEHFARAGFALAALYDTRTAPVPTFGELMPHLSLTAPRRAWRLLKKSRRRRHNPSELLPQRLIEAGVPFVKAGVFRTNHYGLRLGQVLEAVRRATPYDPQLIENHLRRVGTAAA